MKKLLLLTSLILLLVMSAGCDLNIHITSNSKNLDSISGKYVYDAPIYISSLSSESGEYISENIKDMACNISKDTFEVYFKENRDHDFLIKNPKFKKEIMDADDEKDFNHAVYSAVSISSYKNKTQYIICDEHDNRILYRIYKLDDKIWLVSYSTTYVGNNHSAPIIFSIYKLKLNKD